MNTDTSNGTKIRIHEKLLETGEYDKIKTFLRSKLLEAGWFDKVNVLALDQLSTQEKPNFEAVAESIEAKALDLVSENVKQDLLHRISEFLDTFVKNEEL